MKKIFLLSIILLLSCGCSQSELFKNVRIPLTGTMQVKMDGQMKKSNNVTASIANRDGYKMLAITAHFPNDGIGNGLLHIYFNMKNKDLTAKDYSFKNDCVRKSICGNVTYKPNPTNEPMVSGNSTLSGGQAIFKITAIDLRPGGFVEGYFAAALPFRNRKGMAMNDGSFRAKIDEKISN